MAWAFTEGSSFLRSYPYQQLRSISGIFKRLIPYAAPHDLRIVRVNMRNYHGSSKFTEAEISAIADGDAESQAVVIRDLGRQIAAFLEHFGKMHAVPRITEVDGKAQGGMVLLTWSMGSNLATSMLGNAVSLPENTKEFLNQYLRTVILLGKRQMFKGDRLS